MKQGIFYRILLFTFIASAAYCTQSIAQAAKPASKKEAWKPLFNGSTLKGWRTYQNKPADSWLVKNGALYNKGNKDPKTLHADLITEKQYGDFELSFDWKIAPGANSGFLYMVTEEFPASYHSGPEYQMIDDKGYPAKLEEWQKTGANYAMDVPMVDATKPAGQWNHTIIKKSKGHIEHWLNGKKVVMYNLWDETWKQHKSTGKWKDTPGYGMSETGHFAIQDHGGEVWIKNMLIREK